MITDSALTHAVRIAYGIGASITCAALFYMAGRLFLPRRWDDRITPGLAHGVTGAAVYVLVCWFGVSNGVPVANLAFAFAGIVALAACLRYRRVVELIRDRDVFTRAAGQAFSGFVLLYLLAYVLTSPPASSEYLPVAWSGNLDLMTYVRYTRYLLTLGPSNEGGTYLDFVYKQTPGVFYLLGAFSLLFRQDPLNAAMPALFALVALIGMVAANVSRSVFQLTPRAALAVAGIFISGPFFRYIFANYFLSTLMAMPILLFLVWRTVEMRPKRALEPSLVIQFGSAYVLLFFIYPFLLFAAIGLQVAAIGLMLIAGLQLREQRPDAPQAVLAAGRMLATTLIVLAAIALCFWSHMAWSVNMIVTFSEKGAAGWPLDLISPRAMFAWPGARSTRMQVPSGLHGLAIAGFAGIAITSVMAYYWWFRRQTSAAQSAFAGLLAVAIVLYCVYFFVQGPSYQQWKFASYSVLPLSFVLYAGLWHLLWNPTAFARVRLSSTDRRLVTALPAFVAIALVCANVVAHAASDPALRRIPVTLRQLSDLDRSEDFREITVRMNDRADPLPTWLALYYLPNKRVHVVSSKYRPSEPLSLELVSRRRPLLLHNFGCQGVGHDDTMAIPGIGCLLFAPPTLMTGATYPFNRTFLFVSDEGLSARQPDGRWTTRPTVPLKLIADPQRAGLTESMYLNLSMNPSPRSGTTPQRLIFRVADRRGETSITTQEWISLAIRSADWTGNRLWELPVFVDLPDGHPMLFRELSLTEAAQGRVVKLSTELPK
jgi:hypothetical protein